MSPDEVDLLRKIKATYAQLDGWYYRTSTEVEQPQKGSELYGDDQPYPYSPISEMGRMSLAIGTEHLRMVRIVTDNKQLFPTGHSRRCVESWSVPPKPCGCSAVTTAGPGARAAGLSSLSS